MSFDTDEKKIMPSTQENFQKSLPILLNTKEVANWLGISRERVYSLCATQKFPHIKISPKRIRYSVEDIKVWLRERGWNGD